jgi:hypothetical protein
MAEGRDVVMRRRMRSWQGMWIVPGIACGIFIAATSVAAQSLTFTSPTADTTQVPLPDRVEAGRSDGASADGVRFRRARAW